MSPSATIKTQPMNKLLIIALFATPFLSAPAWCEERTLPKKGKPVLTATELKECIEEQEAIRKKTSQYNAEVRRINENVRKYNEMHKQIEAQQASVQDGDVQARIDLNEKIDQLNAFAAKQDEDKFILAKIAEEGDEYSRKFNEKCANRQYKNNDLLKVKRQK